MKLTPRKHDYFRYWDALIAKFEKATGTKIDSFDPNLSGHDDGDWNASFQIPRWLAERIVKRKGKK